MTTKFRLAALATCLAFAGCHSQTGDFRDDGSAISTNPSDAQASLVKTPGFSRLRAGQRDALTRLVAQPTNRYSKAVRRDLATLIGDPGFAALPPDAQAIQLWAITQKPTDLTVAPDAEGLFPGALPSYGQVLAAVVPARVPATLGSPHTAHRIGAPPARDAAQYAAKLRSLKNGERPASGLIGPADFDLTGEEGAVFPLTIDGRQLSITTPLPVPDPHAETHYAGDLVGFSVDAVVEALAVIPRVNRDLFAEVDLEGTYNPLDPIYADVYGRPGFHASELAAIYPLGNFGVFPASGHTEGAVDPNTMVHESGHIWTFEALGLDPSAEGWRAWKEAMTSDEIAPSAYAGSSMMEDSAEAILVYCAVSSMADPAFRSEMKNLFPHRWAFLDARFPRAAAR